MAVRGFFAGVVFTCEVALLTGCGGNISTGSNAGRSDSTDAATIDAATIDAATIDAATAVDAGCPIDPGFACTSGTNYTCANNSPPNGLVCESVGGGLEGTSYCCLQSQNSCKSTGNGCPGGDVTIACMGSDTPFSLSDSIACSMMSGNRYCCSF